MTTEFHHMKQHRAPIEQFRSLNEVLLDGEVAAVKDENGHTTHLKTGDGSTKFNDLPWTSQPDHAFPIPDPGILGDEHLAIFTHIDAAEYGNGSDGALVVGVGEMIINEYALLDADSLADTLFVSVDTVPPSLTAGSLIAIHQTQNYRFHNGDPAAATYGLGNIEYTIVSAVNGTTLTLVRPLVSTFKSDGLIVGGDASNRTVAQIVVIKQYTTVFLNGGDIVAKAWDGETGGLVIYNCQGTQTGSTNVSAVGKGFAGNQAGTVDTEYWSEGWAGQPTLVNPMVDPDLYGSLRAYRESGGNFDDFGGSSSTVGSSVIATVQPAIIPTAHGYPSDQLNIRAIFGTGSSIGDSGGSVENGGGAIIAFVSDLTGFTGSFLAADSMAGSGTITLFSLASFGGTVNVTPLQGGNSVVGGTGIVLQNQHQPTGFSTMLPGPIVAQTLGAGAPDEVPSTQAVVDALSAIEGPVHAFTNDIDMTRTGTTALYTVVASNWLGSLSVLITTSSGTGFRTPATIRVYDATGDLVNTQLEAPVVGESAMFHFDHAHVVGPDTVYLEITTAATHDQQHVSATMIGSESAAPTFSSIEDAFADASISAIWTQNVAGGTLTEVGTILEMAPTVSFVAYNEVTITNTTPLALAGDFFATMSFAEQAWAGNYAGAGTPERGVFYQLDNIVQVRFNHQGLAAGAPRFELAWLDGSAITVDGPNLAVTSGAIRAFRVSGTVYVETFDGTTWSALANRIISTTLTTILVSGYQDSIDAQHTVELDYVQVS